MDVQNENYRLKFRLRREASPPAAATLVPNSDDNQARPIHLSSKWDTGILHFNHCQEEQMVTRGMNELGVPPAAIRRGLRKVSLILAVARTAFFYFPPLLTLWHKRF